MKRYLTGYKKWLMGSLVVMAAVVVTLARIEVSAAHGCHPGCPPTPTLTPTPVVQACEVTEITFLDFENPSEVRAAYNAGETIMVRVSVADYLGAPLVGAKVVAEVNRESLNAQASTGSETHNLDDQSGNYDGVYSQTELPGLYHFTFSVSDPTGERFLPCSGQATIPVEEVPVPVCEIEITKDPDKAMYGIDEAITLTADVTVNEISQSGAEVTGCVVGDDCFDFTGNGPYAATVGFSTTGLYTVNVSAGDPDQAYESCEVSVPIRVGPTCQINLEVEPSSATISETLHLTATVTNTNGAAAEVTATVQQSPDGQEQMFSLSPGDNPHTGIYTDTLTPGEYRFQATAEDSTGENFAACESNWEMVNVNQAGDTVVRVIPEQLETTLCSLKVSSVINVVNVSNLTGVQLKISYDPDVVQVIDADHAQPGVQVRVNDIFATGSISQNAVDTRNGRIFFAANLLDGSTIEGNTGLIAIDWRPHTVGASPVTLEEVVLLDPDGQSLEFEPRDGAVEIAPVSSCTFGVAALQARTDHSGVVVTNAAGQQTVTLPDGSFGIPTSDTIDFEFPGYLSAQADLLESAHTEQVDGETVHLGAITMLAGDVNGDNVVSILDLAHVAKNYLTADPSADLNADGVVNILDLALIAGNYQQQGSRTARP